MDFPIKIGEAITLELVTVDDADEIFKVVDENRQYLQAWLPWVPSVKTVEDEREALVKNVQNFADSKGLDLTIRYDGNIVGRIGLRYIHWEDRRTEIGYWLAQSAGGQGIMNKVCKAMINYLFKTLKFHRIDILCAPENIRSSAIPKRLGFTYEGTLKEASLLNGQYTDLEIYRLLEQEWSK